MKKFNSSLLLIAACTGLFLAGCNQKPAADQAAVTKESATGTIKIQETAPVQNSTASGSMNIVDSKPVDTTAAQDPVLLKIQADAAAKAAQDLKATTTTTTKTGL